MLNLSNNIHYYRQSTDSISRDTVASKHVTNCFHIVNSEQEFVVT